MKPSPRTLTALALLIAPMFFVGCAQRQAFGPGTSMREFRGLGPGATIARHTDGLYEITYHDGEARMLARITGTLVLDLGAEDADLVLLQPGGSFELGELLERGVERWVTFTADETAAPTRVDYAGREEVPLDAERAAFVRDKLERFARSTSVGARAHARGLFARGGVDALVAALELAGDDPGELVAAAIEAPELEGQDLARLVIAVKPHMDGGDATELVHKLAPRELDDAALTAALVEVAAAADAGYRQGEMLMALLQQRALTDEQTLVLLDTVERENSDSSRVELLLAFYSRLPAGDDALVRWIAATESIHSTSSRAELLAKAAARPEAGADVYIALCGAIVRLHSDAARTEALHELVKRAPTDERVLLLLVAATREVHSWSSQTELLLALLDRETLPRPVLISIRDAGAALSSSTSRAAVHERLLERLLESTQD